MNENSADLPQSRAERRSRKLMQGVGLKKVEGIQRVTLRRPRGVSINLLNVNITNTFTAPLRGCQARGVQICCV